MNVEGFYDGLANQINREERQEEYANQRKDRLLALWEVALATRQVEPRIAEAGSHYAANLRGTPAWCARGDHLMKELEWYISKASTAPFKSD